VHVAVKDGEMLLLELGGVEGGTYVGTVLVADPDELAGAIDLLT
jgi:hypothetical protein